MKKIAIIIALLLALAIVFNGIRDADPYQPPAGAYDGLTQEEIQDLEREREASRDIDREVSRSGDHVMIMEATAYTWTGNRTATGTWPKEGRTIAVDPEVIPYGTELVINGRGGYIAEDCGGDIKGNRLDIYMVDRGQALGFGRQTVEVEVIN